MSTPQPLDDYLLELLQPADTPAAAGQAAAAAAPQTAQTAAPDTVQDAAAGAETKAGTGAAAPAAAPAAASAASSGSPAPPPAAAAADATLAGKADDLITEDEFEALLDQLHGPVKHNAPPPAAAAAASPAPVSAPAPAAGATAPLAAPAKPPTAPAPAAMPPAAAAAASAPVRAIPPRAVAANLFAPPPPNRRAEERPTRWLLMRCSGQNYAVELLKVQEVVLPTTLLPLRGAAPSMLGVMNLRGQVVPVIDLSTYLHRPVQESDGATRFVVLEEHGQTLGLRVSAVAEVVDIGIRQIETSEHIQTGHTATGLFHGVARIGKSTVILLDASILMQ